MSNDMSKKLSKALADIRNTYISNADYSTIDAAINKSIDKLSISDLNTNTMSYAETMKQYMTQGIDTTSFTKEITTGVLQSPDFLARFSRYANAEEVIYNISHCNRALQVLSAGIISPDNVTKSSINFLIEDKTDSEDIKEILNNVRIINKQLKIDDMLDNIVTETLKYGDKFIELCSYRAKEIPISQSMYLEELSLYESLGSVGKPPRKPSNKSHKITYEKLLSETPNEYGRYKTETVEFNVTLNLVEDISPNDPLYNMKSKNILTEKIGKPKKDEKLFENIDEMRLIQHDPTKVIKLQSDRFKVNLGYLILPDGVDEGGLGMISSSGLSSATTGNPVVSGLQNDVYMGIDGLYRDLVKMIKRHVNNSDLKVNKKEMKELLARLVKDLDDSADKRELKIRYVPPERMEHFQINERIHFPYGEGIFEKSMHHAKSLIALKTAVAVRRITDSVDKRVIYIESSMPRNSRNMITLLKEALTKRKFSMNNLSNISTIPSMMTSFEDYIITSKNGKRHVEFDTIPTTSNIRDITEELKFYRDELISSLDVPPAYIGIEENLNGKSTLAHESAMFAETIIKYQKTFNKNLFRLFNSIHKLLYGQIIPDCITITLPAPKMLFMSVEAENLETIARVIELHGSLGVEKETLRKKYVPFDFDDEEDAKVRAELDKRSNPSKKTEDDGLLGGGFGGLGMGGMGGMSPLPPTPGQIG